MSRALLLLALLVSGCSLVGPSDADIEAARSPEADGVIVNRASEDIVVMAYDTRIAAAISIAAEFEISDTDSVVRRGEAEPLQVTGFAPGSGFMVYFYSVRGNRATYAASLAVDGDDFERDDRVLTVRRL